APRTLPAGRPRDPPPRPHPPTPPPPPTHLAHVSRRWLRVRDTYAVDVVREDADAALLIAVAVCVIRMAERGD
ncbi:hypothetical protein ACFV5C_32990, partial [Streptomyces sp. NPDC059762]